MENQITKEDVRRG